jgi:hypothetical protein
MASTTLLAAPGHRTIAAQQAAPAAPHVSDPVREAVRLRDQGDQAQAARMLAVDSALARTVAGAIRSWGETR